VSVIDRPSLQSIDHDANKGPVRIPFESERVGFAPSGIVAIRHCRW